MISALPLTPGASVAARPLVVRELGTIGYAECWALQNDIAAAVRSGTSPETLLLLEHPHTYTCGRRGGRTHILLPDEELVARQIAVLDVDRGGDVTYHGPGQMVGYPIINLHAYGQQIDYPAYIRALEEVLIGTLADFSIDAHRISGYSGVWVGADVPEKIAAIGVRVDGHGVTTHGVALNVTTDLTYFDGIVPCGIAGRGVTSMSRILSAAPSMTEVNAHFITHFSRTFCFEVS